MTSNHIYLSAQDEDEMVMLGERLGDALMPGLTVFLEGDLGMGKTTLTRGLLRALGHDGAVKSPTYTLVEPYELEGGVVYHFDLYRVADSEELEFMGIRDYFGDMSLCVVEWPERGSGSLPAADIVINIVQQGRGRRLRFSAATTKGDRVLVQLE